MPRKYESTEKYLKPDPKFNNRLVAKFINNIMKDGKKSIAERIFYESMEIIEKKISDHTPLEVFTEAIHNLKPLLEVRSKRIGGATYQIPMEVPKKRQLALAMRWLLQCARSKKGRPMSQKLADEIIAAYKKEGAAMKIRENVHKMAEANKAFAHFSWPSGSK